MSVWKERESMREKAAAIWRDGGIQRADALFEPAPPLSISCRCFHEINELQLLNKKRQHPAELELVFASKQTALEQVLWPAGSRLRPTWEREKAGKRRKRTSAETPAASRRMRARVTPIRCVAARLAAYWPAKVLARLAEQLCIK